MTDIRWQTAPRPFEVTAADARGRPTELRIGQRRLRLGEVVACHADRVREPILDAHLVTVAMFMLGGGLIVLPVVMNLLEPRYLFGALLFMAIGLSALAEMRRALTLDLVHVRLELAAGSVETFSTTKLAEAEALMALVAAGISDRAR